MRHNRQAGAAAVPRRRGGSDACIVAAANASGDEGIYSQDNLYKKGIVVKHNSENINGAGSCIFMHLWRAESKPTAGCTAMDEQNMDTLLAWLDEAKKPLLVSLTKSQYQQKQEVWQLPKL